MKNRNLGLKIVFALLILISFVPAAFAERGVTDTEILIGQWGPQTGPAALWGAVARGSGCYFDMINDEGGIHGRKIKYFLRDDGYMPPRTKAIVKELVEDKGVFAFGGGVGSACGMAVKKYLETNKVPWVGPSAGSTHWAYPPSRYLFGVYPLYCDEGDILVNYAVNKLGRKRIGVFYQEDDYGKLGLIGVEMSLAKHGLKVVAAVSHSPLDTDLSSHCNKLKAADADCVIMFPGPKQGAIMLMTAAKIGFKPQWMSTSTLADAPIMFMISKGLFKDTIFVTFGELIDSDAPLMKKYKKAQEKFAPKERWGTFFTAGITFVEPMIEGLKRAGRNLDSETFVKAMESIKDFQGTGPKITYSPNIRQGARSMFLAQCLDKGQTKKLSDWLTADLDINEVVKKLSE